MEGDRGVGDRLRLDLHSFLGLDGLVESVRVAPSGHQPSGELIDDDDLAVLHHVVAVALEDDLGLERVLHVVHDAEVFGAVQVGDVERALQLGDAVLSQGYGAVLLVNGEVLLLAQRGRDTGVPSVVALGHVGGAADYERRPSLVDENVVHLVNDGVGKVTLHPFGAFSHHVVAEIVEAELVVGAVGDVGLVRLVPDGRPHALEALFALGVFEVVHERLLVLQRSHADAEHSVNRSHPVGVSAGQVVVDGDDVDAVACEGVEIRWESGDERLALAGPHFGDPALVENYPAD